jgi:hypothetical protein
MVVKKQYALEDDCNGRIIDQKQPFRDVFRVQRKINMSMLFTRRSGRDDQVRILRCPRCDQAAGVPDGNRVKW